MLWAASVPPERLARGKVACRGLVWCGEGAHVVSKIPFEPSASRSGTRRSFTSAFSASPTHEVAERARDFGSRQRKGWPRPETCWVSRGYCHATYQAQPQRAESGAKSCTRPRGTTVSRSPPTGGAKEQLLKSYTYAYRDRKTRKAGPSPVVDHAYQRGGSGRTASATAK